MESGSDRFAIGVLSKRTGCNIETIRYYERAGLLPTPRAKPRRLPSLRDRPSETTRLRPPSPGARVLH